MDAFDLFISVYGEEWENGNFNKYIKEVSETSYTVYINTMGDTKVVEKKFDKKNS